MIRSVAVRSALTVGLVAGLALGVAGAAGTAGATTPKLKSPGKPTAVAVVVANTAFSVSWTAPATDGGAAITGYTATATSHGLPTETCTTTDVLTCLITGIVNPAGKSKNKYKVAITATNSVGTGRPGKAAGTFTGSTAANCSYIGQDANLQGCDLTGANLSGLDLSGADLSGANLSGLDLSGANLSGLDLTGADLSGADLSGADLFLAVLTSADLSGTDLSGADLANANLYYANMSGANLTGVTWQNTGCPDTTNSNTDGWTCVNNLTP